MSALSDAAAGNAGRIRDNIARLRDRIATACGRAGRDPAGVRLVAVTKYVTADITRLVLEAGVTDLAESRPQSIWSKAELLADAQPAARWHLVGHLQRNKVKRTLPLLAMLQSLDSLRLLKTIAPEAAHRAAASAALEVLVEVNLSDDPARSGATPATVPALVRAAAATPGLRLAGLMGMAGHPDAAGADARRDFARLRGLRDTLVGELAAPGTLDELSMGMSGDFEEAILEGATIVRIGSALFDGVA